MYLKALWQETCLRDQATSGNSRWWKECKAKPNFNFCFYDFYTNVKCDVVKQLFVVKLIQHLIKTSGAFNGIQLIQM